MKMSMVHKTVRLLLASLLIAGCFSNFDLRLAKADASNPTTLTTGTTYYIDASLGDDNNPGISEGSAWASLDKVNGTTFLPGDRILFKAGESWAGTLYPKGSGSEGSPITIDKYGAGGKPVINGNGVAYSEADPIDAAVYLSGQSYWTIRNLEVVNDSPVPADRAGIHIDGTSGQHSNIIIEDNYVHHVASDGNASMHAAMSAIIVFSRNYEASYRNVLIQGNTIEATGSTGIYLHGMRRAGPSDNNIVRGNVLSDIGGDGIIVLGNNAPLVEYNVINGFHTRSNKYAAGIWPFGNNDALFQYNEVYGGKTTLDGQAYDADYNNVRTVFQYNYSHDNEGGFFLICAEPGGTNDGSIIRYNISQNDAGRSFQLVTAITNTSIYNNTVYIGPSLNTTLVDVYSRDGTTYPVNTTFSNNIFYNLGTGSYDSELSKTVNTVFEHNAFFGNHPAGEPSDAHKITADPQLASPGSGGIGRGTLAGYQLLNTSPAVGAGKLITNNGGQDYYGNAVSAAAAPNIGAYEGIGLDPDNLPPLPVPPSEDNLLRNSGFETGDFTYWMNHYNGSTIENNNARTGGFAAKVTGNAAGIEQTVTGLYPNTVYKVTAWGKSVNGGDAIFGAKGFGGPETSLHMTAASYKQRTFTFTTGSSNTSATIYLYKSGGSGSVYFDDLELIQFSAAPGGPGGPVYTIGSDDEFNSAALDDQWKWVRENPAKWSLTANPGYLRIVGENGDIASNRTDAKNMLLTGAPSGDWTIETKLVGKPTSAWSQGGLLVYIDDITYLRVTRLYGSGNQFQFDTQIDGVRRHTEVADTIASPTAYLKLEKIGDSYNAYYSPDGSSYTQVGTAVTAELSNPKVGLIVCGGTGMTADFDYFHIDGGTSGPSANLVLNPEFDEGKTYWKESISVQNSVYASFDVVTDAGMSGPHALRVSITNGGSTLSSVQLRQEGIQLAEGHVYTLSFTAKADANKMINVMLYSPVDSSRVLFQYVNLTTSMKTYTYTFTLNHADMPGNLAFSFGSNAVGAYLDQVSLTEGVPR
ncbi:MAG: hypothetical protein K0R57_1510 [Paenibacillaceae bacterium]|jgi:regulation of enolase protein 1 (concanavalin A-like superfamily)|nr:hypothetical protein [Paenibacillaceae bacterium]